MVLKVIARDSEGVTIKLYTQDHDILPKVSDDVIDLIVVCLNDPTVEQRRMSKLVADTAGHFFNNLCMMEETYNTHKWTLDLCDNWNCGQLKSAAFIGFDHIDGVEGFLRGAPMLEYFGGKIVVQGWFVVPPNRIQNKLKFLKEHRESRAFLDATHAAKFIICGDWSFTYIKARIMDEYSADVTETPTCLHVDEDKYRDAVEFAEKNNKTIWDHIHGVAL